MLLSILSLLACQSPFGTDRHHLEGFRVAAARAVPDADGWSVSAALVVDGHLWSDQAVALRWYALPDRAALATLSVSAPADAEGPVAHLSGATVGVGLIATGPAGDERRVWLEPSTTAIALRDVTVERVDGVTVDALTAEDLTVDARSAWVGTPDTSVPAGGAATLTAVTEGDTLRTARWMEIGEPGELLEIDGTRSSWLAGSILVDGEEVLERTIAAPGPVSLLVLALGEAGGTDFRAEELWVGPPSQGLFTASGRWIGVEPAVDADAVRGTLVADDAAPTGLALTDAVAFDPLLEPLDPWGTEALPCVGVSGPFDPSWLLDGRCVRADLIGRVVGVSR